MNKIIVEVSIGELLDKISILEIKQGKIKDPEKSIILADLSFVKTTVKIETKINGMIYFFSKFCAKYSFILASSKGIISAINPW